MTIYVDGLASHAGGYHGKGAAQAARVGARNGHRWCHLMADEADCSEIHDFAARLGMKREWFQGDHYDLTPQRRVEAVRLGAVEVDSRRLVEIRRKQRRKAA